MCPGNLFSLLFVFLALSVFVAVYWSQKQKISNVLYGLNARGKGLNVWEITCEGKTVSFFYSSGSRNTPASMSLSYEGEFNGHCLIRRECGADKFYKSAGINKEPQVFDPELEHKYYFECEDDSFVRSLVAKPEVKDCLRVIFDNFSFTQVKIEGHVCTFYKSPANLDEYTPEQLKIFAARLVEFVAQLPPLTSWGVSATPKSEAFVSKKKIWDGFSFGLFLAGVFLLFVGIKVAHPVFPGKLFLSSLWLSIPAVLMIVLFAFNQLSGHATSAQTLLKVIFLGSPGFVVFIWVAMLLLNSFLDTSLPVAHKVFVIDKKISHSKKHGNSYYLVLATWEKDQTPYSFHVNSAVYGRTPIMAACEVETKNGFFGFQWISSCACSFKK